LNIRNVPFEHVDWKDVPVTEHPGTTGIALWRTRQLGEIRVRMVEYSADYLADHWCRKGHILLVLEGTLITELDDGRTFTLTPGTSYQVEDETYPHRSYTKTGAKLFIVD
jgi:quercetin dioxygenase-like cupin family protein